MWNFDVQDPREELAIRRLIVAGWAALDRGDWATFASAFAEDGEFEVFGKLRRGRAEIAAGPAGDLVHFQAHVIANELINIDEAEATGQWYAIAMHVPDATQPGQHAEAGVRYTFRARRESAAWRFSQVRLVELLWTTGLPLGATEVEEPQNG